MTELYVIVTKFCKHALPRRCQGNMKWENEIVLEPNLMYSGLDETANGLPGFSNSVTFQEGARGL